MHLQKVNKQKIFFVCILKVTEEKCRIRIRTKMSRIHNTGMVSDRTLWLDFGTSELCTYLYTVQCTDCLQKVLYTCVHSLEAAVLSCT
jgi:hypothetical protein